MNDVAAGPNRHRKSLKSSESSASFSLLTCMMSNINAKSVILYPYLEKIVAFRSALINYRFRCGLRSFIPRSVVSQNFEYLIRGFCYETLCGSNTSSAVWHELEAQTRASIALSKTILRQNKAVLAQGGSLSDEDRERVMDTLRGPSDEFVLDQSIHLRNENYFERVARTAINTLAKDNGRILREPLAADAKKIPNLTKLCDVVQLSSRYFYRVASHLWENGEHMQAITVLELCNATLAKCYSSWKLILETMENILQQNK